MNTMTGTDAAPLLSRGVDVELRLQDVVNDWLAEVVHHVAIAMLEGQSANRKTPHQHGHWHCSG